MVRNANRLRNLKASVICAVMLAASATYVTAQTGDTPEGRVQNFYGWYLKAMVAEQDPTKDKAATNSHLSTRFSRWYYSKAGQNADSDAFVDSQEWDDAWADNIEVGKAVITGNKAVVKVMLSAPPDESVMTLQVSLVKEAGKWKVDRVKALYEKKGTGTERMT